MTITAFGPKCQHRHFYIDKFLDVTNQLQRFVSDCLAASKAGQDQQETLIADEVVGGHTIGSKWKCQIEAVAVARQGARVFHIDAVPEQIWHNHFHFCHERFLEVSLPKPRPSFSTGFEV